MVTQSKFFDRSICESAAADVSIFVSDCCMVGPISSPLSWQRTSEDASGDDWMMSLERVEDDGVSREAYL